MKKYPYPFSGSVESGSGGVAIGNPSMCAKLRTMAASNNRDHAAQSLFAYASNQVQSFTC